jgi:UPF0755 protein
MTQFWSLLFRATTKIIIIIFCGILWALLCYIKDGNNQEEIPRIEILKGQSLKVISQNLTSARVIEYPSLFRLWARVWGYDKKIQAGLYTIPARTSMATLLDIFTNGSVSQFNVTVPEGYSSARILSVISSNDQASQFFKIPPNYTLEEGTCLPETYACTSSDTLESFITRIQQAQKKYTDTLWDSRPKNYPIKTKAEWIKIASIVEKETNYDDEYGLIARIILNRLKKGMRLELCSTVIYGLTKGMPLERTLTIKETKIKNPYNTYTNRGLPPTPICHPGKKVLKAILNIPQSDHLFFVKTGHGGHYFSKNYNNHKKNIQLYEKAKKAKRLPNNTNPEIKNAAFMGLKAETSYQRKTKPGTKKTTTKPN